MLRIVILGVRVRAPLAANDPGHISGRIALWVNVPAGCEKFYADPTATSAYLDISADQLAALREGRIAERVETGDFDLIVAGAARTLESLRPYLEEAWQAFQNEVDDHEWHKYGTSWDDQAVWAETGVA